MASKMKLEFDGFNEVMERLKNLDGNVRQTSEKALKETHRIVTAKAEEAIRPHKRSGRTEQSLQRQAKVNWQGSLGTVDVGFDIEHGGLPSIFLMYGTPRMKKDQKVYNAFFGKATLKEVFLRQEEVFYNEIRKLGG